MVEEFIATVSEIVPELLNADQKAELLLGLRARVSLRCPDCNDVMLPLEGHICSTSSFSDH